jgi:hypothetical protein
MILLGSSHLTLAPLFPLSFLFSLLRWDLFFLREDGEKEGMPSPPPQKRRLAANFFGRVA